MLNNLYIQLESERVLLRPVELEDEIALQEIANDDSLWIYGLQDLSKPGELNKYLRNAIADRELGATREGILRQHMKIHNGYIRNTVFYSILASEWETIREQYFTNFKTLL